ncbi:MAG: hypothetical protein JWM96_250, partial [Alphaproteobacteria bacterium]|nr:hypothetical protein [Alphaproteobacteria bacterium]
MKNKFVLLIVLLSLSLFSSFLYAADKEDTPFDRV